MGSLTAPAPLARIMRQSRDVSTGVYTKVLPAQRGLRIFRAFSRRPRSAGRGGLGGSVGGGRGGRRRRRVRGPGCLGRSRLGWRSGRGLGRDWLVGDAAPECDADLVARRPGAMQVDDLAFAL